MVFPTCDPHPPSIPSLILLWRLFTFSVTFSLRVVQTSQDRVRPVSLFLDASMLPPQGEEWEACRTLALCCSSRVEGCFRMKSWMTEYREWRKGLYLHLALG